MTTRLLTVICVWVLALLSTVPATAGVTFTELSDQLGMRVVHDPTGPQGANLYGPGVALADVNNDGWIDVFFTNGPGAGNRLFLNNGNWSFTDASDAYFVSASRGGNGVAFGDIDNNGRPDFAVGNYHSQPHLYVNQNTRFRSIEDNWGIVPLIPSSFWIPDTEEYFPSPESMGVAFGDYNQDGLVDLYVANYRFQVDVLYKNVAKSFFQFAQAASPSSNVWGFTGVFTDLDDDNDLDIFVANDFGANFFYENQGAAGNYTFVEKANTLGIRGGTRDDDPKAQSMGVAIADYDNDLDLDIYITNFQLNALYRNNGVDSETGELQFVDVAAFAGVEYDLNCWGVDLVDLDNDTDLDLIFSSGHIFSNDFFQPLEIPDQVYLNNGPEQNYTFTAVNEQAGFASTMLNRGLATGDLDRDGDLDVVTTANTYEDLTPGAEGTIHEGHTLVYRNDQDSGNNWVNLRLEGRAEQGGVTNRSGIGAKVYLTTTDDVTMMREIHAGSSFMSHHSLNVEFGLGQADVASVQVRWPGGDLEDFTGITANRHYDVIEGEGAYPVALALSSFEGRSLDRGVLLRWQSAPGLGIVDVDVERADTRDPERFVRLDDVEVTFTATGGEVFDRGVVAGVTYRYRLTVHTDDGHVFESTIAEVRAIDGTTPLARRAAVGQNYPNPFNPTTRIEFTLPRPMVARLVIHDARGRLVRTLYDAPAPAGSLDVDWDGRDDTGREVSSGVYIYSLITDDGTSARRMVLTR